eukprot:CFRG5592T1
MSVLSANIFDMLQDDADSGSVATSVKKVETPTPAPAPVKKTAPPKKETPARENKPRGENSARGARGGARTGDRSERSGENRERREPRENREHREPRAPKAAGAGGAARNDRHSRGPKGSSQRSEKKEGHGRHNWGEKVESEATAVEGGESTEAAEPAAPREPTEEELAAKAEHEAEEKQMTLDAYQKQQAEKKVGTEITIRQAGEGVDNSEWKDTVKVTKKDAEAECVAPGAKKSKGKKSKKAIAEAAPIDIKYNDDQSRREQSGGRGGFNKGPRGGARGGARSGRAGNAPSLADESAFPSLG